MTNMSYCRFENTAQDLRDCRDHINEDDLSSSEHNARRRVILLCRDILVDLGAEVDIEHIDPTIIGARDRLAPRGSGG